jgi:exosortase
MNSSLENEVALRDSEPNARTRLPAHTSSYGLIAALLISLFVFWAPLQALVKFSGNSEYSYIPLMPPISAFLILMRRDSIFREAEPAAWTGGCIVAGGISLLFLSNLFGTHLIGRLELSALAIVSTWCGLFVICYGTEALRRAILPICLLLFMIPAPESVMNSVVQFLQHGSAVLSYHLFRLIGVPAVREGMIISLPRIVLEVAPECSGIRSSISLMILTLAGANLYLRSGWNKILLVLTLVPLVILKNAIRIVTLSTLALYVNPGFLNGRLHHQGGIVFFLIAVAMLLPIVALMRRHERKRGLAAHPLQVNPRSR